MHGSACSDANEKLQAAVFDNKPKLKSRCVPLHSAANVCTPKIVCEGETSSLLHHLTECFFPTKPAE